MLIGELLDIHVRTRKPVHDVNPEKDMEGKTKLYFTTAQTTQAANELWGAFQPL
jgi:hypothetical protein